MVMENLVVKDVINSNIAVATEAGDRIFNRLVTYFDRGEKVKLDFADVSIISTAFLNAAIGQLYSQGKYSSEFLNNSLKLENIQPEDKPLFVMVVNRAKEYFSNKRNFENYAHEVFDN